MVSSKTIGKNLKQLRKQRKLPQEAIADAINAPRSAISLIESGKRDLTAQELYKLTKFLRINPEAILDPSDGGNKEESSTEPKKITLIRHGEAMDDLYNQYGGWADPELSAAGINDAFERMKLLKEKAIRPDIVFSSPLKRALQKAEIISAGLKVPCKELQYLKERNTYGLLCGMNKDFANREFPELVEMYEKGEFVMGSERYEDFIQRLHLIFDLVERSEYQNVICVTHGKLITAILKEILNMKVSSLSDGCTLVVGLDEQGTYYIGSEGIQFKR